MSDSKKARKAWPAWNPTALPKGATACEGDTIELETPVAVRKRAARVRRAKELAIAYALLPVGLHRWWMRREPMLYVGALILIFGNAMYIEVSRLPLGWKYHAISYVPLVALWIGDFFTMWRWERDPRRAFSEANHG